MTVMKYRFSLGTAAAIAALLIGSPSLQAGNLDNAPPAAANATQLAVADPAARPASPLPASDAIGPGADLAALLKPGVSAEVTRAALRRAWISDPAIRDFVGMTEDVVESAR